MRQTEKKALAKLNELYRLATTTGDISYAQKLSEVMTSDTIQSVIQTELRNENSSNLSALNLILQCANIIDNNSGFDTGISDTDYDTLYDKYGRMSDLAASMSDNFMSGFPSDFMDTLFGKRDDADETDEDLDTNWYTTPVLSGNGTEKVPHKYMGLRGTLDKIYYLTDEEGEQKKINKSRKGLPWWKSTVKRKLADAGRGDINVDDLWIYVFPKFDGLSGIFEFSKDGDLERVLTRGDTKRNLAENVTHLFDFWVKGEKRDHPYGLKTEIHMDEEDYLKYNEKYGTNFKSSRQIVSSLMNSDKPDKRIEFLHIVPLRIAEMEHGIEQKHILSPKVFDYPYIRCQLKETDKIEEFALSHKYAKGLRCDGAVIHIIDPAVQDILGRENDRDKFEVAYKFTEEVTHSKVVDVQFTPGLFGNIVPTVKFKPVVMKGNTIEHASLGSCAIATSMHLAKGDTIRIHYDIIPTVVYDENDPKCTRSGNVPIAIPTECPDCGEPLDVTATILSCKNPNCPCRERGKIYNYCQSMGMQGIGEETISDFYYEGYVKKIKDLYKLKNKKKELMDLPGYGKKSIKLILDEIDRTKKTDIVTVLGSIGIKGVRGKTFKKIFDSGITYEELKDCADDGHVHKLSEIPGIGEVTAKLVLDGIYENMHLIEFLEKELDINTHTEKRDQAPAKFQVVFSNIRDASMESYIEQLGGAVGSGVSKKTDLLIVPELGVSTTKVSKAETLGVPIVSFDQAKDYIDQHFVEPFK